MVREVTLVPTDCGDKCMYPTPTAAMAMTMPDASPSTLDMKKDHTTNDCPAKNNPIDIVVRGESACATGEALGWAAVTFCGGSDWRFGELVLFERAPHQIGKAVDFRWNQRQDSRQSSFPIRETAGLLRVVPIRQNGAHLFRSSRYYQVRPKFGFHNRSAHTSPLC
ncbi:MAG: hypothetical protein R3C03_05405 [Pirellulaceae bacterium]